MRESLDQRYGEEQYEQEIAVFSQIQSLMHELSFRLILKPEQRALALAEIKELLKDLLNPARFVGENKGNLTVSDITNYLERMASEEAWNLRDLYQLAFDAGVEIVDEHRQILGEAPLRTNLSKSAALEILNFLEEEDTFASTFASSPDDDGVLQKTLVEGNLRPDQAFLELLQIYCHNQVAPDSKSNSFPTAMGALLHALHETALQHYYQVACEESSFSEPPSLFPRKP